jgi:hypothetical protein
MAMLSQHEECVRFPNFLNPKSYFLNTRSFADDFDQCAFAAVPVEFAVEDLFPRPQVELAIGNCDDNFPAHDRSFEVGVGVVLRAVVTVLAVRFFGREFLEPDFEVVVQTAFVVVDEDTGRDVHRVDQAQAFTDAAFANGPRDVVGDVQELPALRHIEPELFAKGFHAWVESGSQEAGKDLEGTRGAAERRQATESLRWENRGLKPHGYPRFSLRERNHLHSGYSEAETRTFWFSTIFRSSASSASRALIFATVFGNR